MPAIDPAVPCGCVPTLWPSAASCIGRGLWRGRDPAGVGCAGILSGNHHHSICARPIAFQSISRIGCIAPCVGCCRAGGGLRSLGWCGGCANNRGSCCPPTISMTRMSGSIFAPRYSGSPRVRTLRHICGKRQCTPLRFALFARGMDAAVLLMLAGVFEYLVGVLCHPRLLLVNLVYAGALC